MRLLAATLFMIAVPSLAMATENPVGLYRATEGPELASRLQLTADGHFRYELAYGALDERAEGTWHAEQNSLRLTTKPRPRPPEFRADSMTASSGTPLSLKVSWPNGGGIAGVDFTIGFESGEPVQSYTQQDGWTADPSDKRHALWIELYEPINGIGPKRFEITGAATNSLRFTLIPNDMGIVDFQETRVTITGDRLVLHHPRGDLHYMRINE